MKLRYVSLSAGYRQKSEEILAVIGTIQAIVSHGHLKNSGTFNRVQNHDLCNAGAILHQMSYDATHLGLNPVRAA